MTNIYPFREKFIFAHEHPESFWQVCSIYNSDPKKLHAYFTFFSQGYKMSERQFEALEKNRDSSIFYLRQCIQSSNIIRHEYKYTIVDLKAYELIPDIMAIEKKGIKDTYIYTLLMLLMNDNYPDFKKSELYTLLYRKDRPFDMDIPITKEKIQSVIELTNQFYNWKTSSK